MRQRSLRVRLTVAFGIGAALLSAVFASLAYLGVRHILVSDRESTDLKQAYVNAALVKSAAVADTPSMRSVVHSLDTATTSLSIVDFEGVWYATGVNDPRAAVPPSVRAVAAHDLVGHQVLGTTSGPALLVDVPLPGINATYYQIHSLNDLNNTLRALLWLLGIGAVITTAMGAAGGWFITRRALAPLEVAAGAAQRVAEGQLETRIPENPRSSEVDALATSFNRMVEMLVDRLERDARFAGDVSHELRSPLTTLSNSVEVMRRSRDGLSPEGQTAYDLLEGEIGIFQQFVEDLLEIARLDAGASSMHLEDVSLEELVRRSVRSATTRRGLSEVPIDVGKGVTHVRVRVDRRRFERVISNLLENANRYGGGAVAVRLTRVENAVAIDVDDAGGGVPEEDRDRIFDRFNRGSLANDRGQSRGTGLGLAIVADHIAHFGGTVRVIESPEGGARFRIELPMLDWVYR